MIKPSVQLSERMAAVAAMVTPGNRLADVGCDHGYLSIWLCGKGIVPSAAALDVNPGPLSAAKKNIAEQGLGAYIETRLSDGLEAVKPGEADTVVIAGMGGRLMSRILREGEKVLRTVRELVLEPQSEPEELRRCLMELRFRIEQEDMVREAGKYYPVIRAVPGEERRLGSEELRYGPLLLKDRHPVLLQYLKKEEAQLLRLERALSGRTEERSRERALEIQEELRMNRRALAYYEE